MDASLIENESRKGTDDDIEAPLPPEMMAAQIERGSYGGTSPTYPISADHRAYHYSADVPDKLKTESVFSTE
jgi:hypothetical protein